MCTHTHSSMFVLHYIKWLKYTLHLTKIEGLDKAEMKVYYTQVFLYTNICICNIIQWKNIIILIYVLIMLHRGVQGMFRSEERV